MINHRMRCKLADGLQAALPWASITVGAPGYPFILVDRGEQIAGSFTEGPRTSVWTRAIPGSRFVMWEKGEDVWLCEDRNPSAGRRGFRAVESVAAPVCHGRAWIKHAMPVLVEACERWCVPVDPNVAAKHLRANERLEIRIRRAPQVAIGGGK